jgi:hypothetical protein
VLARGPSELPRLNLVLVLRCGSGTSSNFLIKILIVNTPLFLHNTQFKFSHSLLLLRRSHKIKYPFIDHRSRVDSFFTSGAGDPDLHSQLGFFNHQVCNGFGDCNISFIF